MDCFEWHKDICPGNRFGPGYVAFTEKYQKAKNPFPIPSDRSQVTDIIVPVYNGLDYLPKLFSSIEKTAFPYRLIIINDQSPDPQIEPFLREYASSKENVILISNPENLGFVQSVNKGLAMAEHHVAIVNTDVEVPSGWLERLMAPIWNDETIASTTPFTNSGTICSFPNFCENNEIFGGLGVDDIDAVFAELIPCGITVPTGVGFCMGMNRKAIREIGLLDAETFYKGYGEENDWCQRAIEAGYRNIHIEDLFVYHKHGGSFIPEDKKKYIERNSKLLLEKHPDYDRMVADYIQCDPARPVRGYALMKLASRRLAAGTTLYFSHNWGGGAEDYLKNRIESEMKENRAACVVIGDRTDGIYLDYYYAGRTARYSMESTEALTDLLQELQLEKIVINEVVTFPDLYEILDYILEIKNLLHVPLTMLGHDFYSICPAINLLDEDQYCGIPEDPDLCEKCLGRQKLWFNKAYGSIRKWRAAWGKFLDECDEIVVFSHNTRELLEKAYGKRDTFLLRPHKVEGLAPVEKEKTTRPINIGVLGVMCRHKGAAVINEMLRIIREKDLDVRMILIGPNEFPDMDPDLIVTGAYEKKDLAARIRAYDIDIFFIASICPETFSYTTEEVMMMQMPLAVFDLGAPAERAKKYDKSLIIPEVDAELALNQIIDFVTSDPDWLPVHDAIASKEARQLERENQQLEREKQQLELEKQKLGYKADLFESGYSTVVNSFTWRATYPFRRLLDYIKFAFCWIFSRGIRKENIPAEIDELANAIGVKRAAKAFLAAIGTFIAKPFASGKKNPENINIDVNSCRSIGKVLGVKNCWKLIRGTMLSYLSKSRTQ